MCGAGLASAAEFCAECGERVLERTLPDFERVPSFLELRYEQNLHVLQWLLIAFGHLTLIVSIGLLSMEPLSGLIVFVAATAWIVAGYACAYQQRWGILTALIVSYLMLAGCLLYWNLTGIAVSLTLSIQAHRVLRFSHQVIAESLGQEKDA